MITQGFLTEFELSLLKAYNRANSQSIIISGNESNFVGASRFQNEFLKSFMVAFQQQRHILERELRKGGNNPDKMMEKINSEVEAKLRKVLFHNSRLDQQTFQNIAREMKKDIRNVFYDNYLSKV
ncbi:hypothetical protein HYX11_02840 [Candidatus Woesearchaeota archaeon]|nr:hypothetical protein [Candidatus Woesearchaeota archaeon]